MPHPSFLPPWKVSDLPSSSHQYVTFMRFPPTCDFECNEIWVLAMLIKLGWPMVLHWPFLICIRSPPYALEMGHWVALELKAPLHSLELEFMD